MSKLTSYGGQTRFSFCRDWFYPCDVDTALSGVLVFKLFRTKISTGILASPAIVITSDIIVEYRDPHYFAAGKVLSVEAFYPQRVKAPFCAGDIIAVASGTLIPAQIMLLRLQTSPTRGPSFGLFQYKRYRFFGIAGLFHSGYTSR